MTTFSSFSFIFFTNEICMDKYKEQQIIWKIYADTIVFHNLTTGHLWVHFPKNTG